MALPGGSRCAEHQRERNRVGQAKGTTAAWRKAREAALRRDGHRCVVCGSTEKLQVHHIDGRGVGADEHPLELLEVRCLKHHHEATAQLARQRRLAPRR